MRPVREEAHLEIRGFFGNAAGCLGHTTFGVRGRICSGKEFQRFRPSLRLSRPLLMALHGAGLSAPSISRIFEKFR